MKRLALFLIAAISLCASANAKEIALEFEVNVDYHQSFSGSRFHYEDEKFEWTMVVDTRSLAIQRNVYSSGSVSASTFFPGSSVPPTQYSRAYTDGRQLLDYSMTPTISRDYSSSSNNTFQGISLSATAQSEFSFSRPRESFRRGVRLNLDLGAGDSATTFNSETFVAYMQSLIGNEDFSYFDDQTYTQYYTSGYSERLGATGYFGTATLLSVNAVPEPGTVGLIFVGLGACLFAGRRFRRAVPVK